MSSVQDYIVSLVEQEMAEFEAQDAAIAAGLVTRRSQAGQGPSVVFSVRLDRRELASLEMAAATGGLKPSVLARNLIRSGLATRGEQDIAHALDRVVDAVADLRDLVPRRAHPRDD